MREVLHLGLKLEAKPCSAVPAASFVHMEILEPNLSASLYLSSSNQKKKFCQSRALAHLVALGVLGLLPIQILLSHLARGTVG